VPQVPAEGRVGELHPLVGDRDDIGEQAFGAGLIAVFHQALQPVQGIDVVGIEDGGIFAPGQAQAPVDGVEGILVFLVVVGQAGIGVPLHHFAGAVAGAVIDDDQLEVGAGLAEDALDGSADEPFVIVGRDDDGNKGYGHNAQLSLWLGKVNKEKGRP